MYNHIGGWIVFASLASLEDITKALGGLKPEIRRRFKADIKGVFGSFSRGEAGPKSDIDVLVEFDETADLLDLTGLGIYLEDKLGRQVDIVPESAIKIEIKDEILKQTVYI